MLSHMGNWQDLSSCQLEMSERLCIVRERSFWTSGDMMSVMREIEDYVLDSPIALTFAYDELIEKFRAAFLALQHFHPQLVEVYQPQIVSEGESPKSPSDSAEEKDDAQTIIPGQGT